jgi:hypothetical protein
MPEVKIVGRGVDTLVLNVCYADKQFQPVKQELNADLQEVLSTLQGEARINESAIVTNWPLSLVRMMLCSWRMMVSRLLYGVCRCCSSG